MQSKKQSLAETATMAIVGYIFSVLGQMCIFRIIGLPWHVWQCIWIGGFFFFVSIGKNFVIRRLFEKCGKK